MEPTPLIWWLMKKRRTAMASAVAVALAEWVAGSIVLFLTFGLFFLISKIFLLLMFPSSALVTVLAVPLAVIIVALLFIDGLSSVRDDMSLLPVWFLREALDIAPWMILDSVRHGRRAWGLLHLNLETSAQVLAALASRATPTTRRELARWFPAIEWAQIAAQLRLIDGVIFFRNDPELVTLTMPLRLAIRSILGPSKAKRVAAPPASEPQPEPEPEPEPVSEPAKLSACEVLGVAPEASAVEIKAAYRARIKECHPDRFAGMDEQSKQLAEEWTKALNAAYESLLARNRVAK